MIREMKATDWDAMMEIYMQSLEKGTVTFQTECPTYEEWDAAHCKECRYVYESDGKVVGYTMIAPTSKREAYRGIVELSIFVDEKYLRQGIGRQMLTKLCAETEKRGYWTLYSAIFSVNEASIELHKRCGFRVIGYRAYDTEDDYEPLVAAGKLLNEFGFTLRKRKNWAYVLIGYPGDSFENAEKRLKNTLAAGFIPFAMLYKSECGFEDPEWKPFQRAWCRPAAIVSSNKEFFKGS